MLLLLVLLVLFREWIFLLPVSSCETGWERAVVVEMWFVLSHNIQARSQEA